MLSQPPPSKPSTTVPSLSVSLVKNIQIFYSLSCVACGENRFASIVNDLRIHVGNKRVLFKTASVPTQ